MRYRTPVGIVAAMGFILACAAVTAPAEAGTRAKNQVHTLMMNSGSQPAARGKITYVQNKAQSSFTIGVQGLAAGAAYDVLVGGTVRDRITTNAAGKGKVTHRSRARVSAARALPYDPRGSTVQIASAGAVILSAEVPETEEECDALIEIPLHLTAAAGVAGEASAEFRARGGRMKFEVEMRDVAAGTYDLVVAGAKAGEIVVGVDGEGEITFDSRPTTDDAETPDDEADDAMDVLLTFDPRGQLVEIQQTGVTLFSGTLPTEPPAGEPEDGDDDGDGGGHDGGDDGGHDGGHD